MAKKSKASKEATERDEDEGGEEEEEEEEAPRKSKKNKKKSAKSESKSNGNVVTLKQLAADAELTPQVARQKLRAAGIEREDGSRWQWEKGSKALKKAEDALSGE